MVSLIANGQQSILPVLMRLANADVLDKSALYSAARASHSGKTKGNADVLDKSALYSAARASHSGKMIGGAKKNRSKEDLCLQIYLTANRWQGA